MKKGAFRFPMIKVEGGGSPDPVIYCPANGYIPDPTIYIPPVVMPETTTESITFICNAAIANWRCETNRFKFVKGGGGSFYLYELFDNTATLIDSWTSTAQWMDFDFPTNDMYYTVKVSVQSPGYFTAWHNNDGTATPHDDCIEAVLINCPTSFGGFSVKGNNNITTVKLTDATLANINSFAYAFDTCPKVNYWQPNYAAILNHTSLYYMFRNSGLFKIDLSDLDTSSLTFSASMFMDCKYLLEVIFPEVWCGTRNYNMFSNTPRLTKVVMPTTWAPSGTPYNSLAYFFNKSGVEGEIIFPEIPGAPISNVSNMFYEAPNVQIIRLKGNWENLSSFSGFFSNNLSLEIFEAPRIILRASTVFYSSWGSTPALKQYIGPDIGFMFFPSSGVVESITGEHDTSLFATKPNVLLSTNYRTTLAIFNCIKLQVNYLLLGSTSNKFTALNAVEIDWAGSTWAGSAPQLRLSAALPATELNRIMTALPTVSSGQVVDIGYCDGYVECDHSIANSKGWSVRGFVKFENGTMSPVDRTTATFNGYVNYLGGYTPVTVGVCFRTTPLPTIANNPKNISVSAPGAFSIAITTGLAANTLYYARAYAASSYGTSYGTEFTFTTLP